MAATALYSYRGYALTSQNVTNTSAHLPCVFLPLVPGENTLMHENVRSLVTELNLFPYKYALA